MGSDVCVGATVGSDSVTVGDASTVGVSVTGAFEGRLQASIAKTSTSMGDKVRKFMISPLFSFILYGMIPLTMDC